MADLKTPDPTAVEVRNAVKAFGQGEAAVRALDDVSITIRKGEFFTLLGPSGCGKTTLLRLIAGFETPTSGRILLEGQDLTNLPPNKRPVNTVFQSYALFPHLSVAQNVGFGLEMQGRPQAEVRATVERMLALVKLEPLASRRTSQLSGGQQQRVALARALAPQPKVLLLDEPLSALDKKMREQMQVELIRLQRQVGITFILVTHDQEEALVMSDRIAVMFEGEIGQLADPETLYRRPNSKRVAEFIGKMNLLDGEVTAAGGDKISFDVAGLGAGEIGREQAPGGVKIGRTLFGIRPETLGILFQGETTERRVADAVVDEVVYYGDMTYYDVRVQGVAKPLTISMKNLIGRPVLDVGVRTKIIWDERSLIVLAS